MTNKSKSEKSLSTTSPHLPGLFTPDSFAFSPPSSTDGVRNRSWGHLITLLPLPCFPSQAVPLLQCQVPPKGYSLFRNFSSIYPSPNLQVFRNYSSMDPFPCDSSVQDQTVFQDQTTPAWFPRRSQLLTENLLLHGFPPWTVASLSLCGLSPSSPYPSCLLQLGAFC